ncbi:MAG: hypothetical protein Q4B26_03180 [Eubacteriales bacterium]|nr:hypothetical protein [Eubacteriales bacterium]
MRMVERLIGLKNWTYNNMCKGTTMKAPAPNMDITQIVRKEPQVYLAWAPSRIDKTGRMQEDVAAVVPGIIIMPNQSFAKYVEEKRFDRYNGIHRAQQMGQHLNVSVLFSVYEPGIRLKGFKNTFGENGEGIDLSLIQEGTEEGLFTLMNWMDDFMEKLLGQKIIPHTDLFVEESTMTYSLYTDQNYVVDRRPIYYGFINVSFGCYATEEANHRLLNELL